MIVPGKIYCRYFFAVATNTFYYICAVFVAYKIRSNPENIFVPPILNICVDIFVVSIVILMIFIGITRKKYVLILQSNNKPKSSVIHLLITLYFYIFFSILIYILQLYPTHNYKLTKAFIITIFLFYIIYWYVIIDNIIVLIKIIKRKHIED
jgi:hypothetical protein